MQTHVDPFPVRPLRGLRVLSGAAIALTLAPQSHAQNLLTNGTFESGVSGYQTEYGYFPGGDPGPGAYTLGNNPHGWNSLFSSCQQHTPGGSKMMILDGDTHRVAWAEQLHNLIPGTTYRLQLWAMTLYPDNPAVIRVSFRPEPAWTGTVVPPSILLPLATCQWQQLSFVWYCDASYWTPAQTDKSITVIVENTTSGTTGADFAIDDLVFDDPLCWAAPQITADPPASTVCTTGGTAVITAGVQSNSRAWGTGGPPPPPPPAPYLRAWRRNGVPLVNGATPGGSVISGADMPTLTITNLTASDSGRYSFKITTECGTATSNPSFLVFLTRLGLNEDKPDSAPQPVAQTEVGGVFQGPR